MKNFGKRILSVGLVSVMLSTGVNVRACPLDTSIIFYNAVGSTIASAIPKIFEKIYDVITSNYERLTVYLDVEKNKGFRTPEETMKKLVV